MLDGRVDVNVAKRCAVSWKKTSFDNVVGERLWAKCHNVDMTGTHTRIPSKLYQESRTEA